MERKLPAISELINGSLEIKGRQNELNVLLNQEPNPAWLKEHPTAKGVKYIPIERIEWLLTRLFIKWRVEIKTVEVMANSCVVSVRLHYQNILDDTWDWQDGVGAAPIQTDKGAGAMDWNKAKADGVMKAAPAAESYAIKDAAEKLGKVFGKDINRKDEIGYSVLLGQIPAERHAEVFENNENN